MNRTDLRARPSRSRLQILLLSTVAILPLLPAPALAGEGEMRILSLNTWIDRFKPNPAAAMSEFLVNGDYDILTFQELRGDSTYLSTIPPLLENEGLGTYTTGQSGDVGVASRLAGSHGSHEDGVRVSYQTVDAQNKTPETVVGTVHLNYYDEPTYRIDEAKALNDWAKAQARPVIITGDFNAGDLSERGLHNAEQQSYLFARTIIDGGSSDLWRDLAQQYTPEGREADFLAYVAAMQATDDNGNARYRNVIQSYFDSHRDEFPGIDSISSMSWRQWEQIVAKDMAGNGLTFEDETYPVASNVPQTLNILKKQYILLQKDSEREVFAPHGLGDGSTTWPSAGEDHTNTWTSWDRVTIDHFMAARPFGKWQVLADDPDDAYTGVLDDTGYANDGTTPLSDHEPVAHVVKWVGPALETYTAADGDATRLIWGEAAGVFAEKGKIFYLTRNNMRTDLYLGQIADENGMPVLSGLTEDEKKTLLDCASDDARLQAAIQEYCIDDHSFIGETLVTDAGTVIVDEDAALGNATARLRLDNGGLRIAGTRMATLARDVSVEAGGGFIEVADADAAVTASGVFSGSGAFAKTGAGTLTLAADNSFTGTTTVEAGRLNVDGSLAGSAQTTVRDGATLGGTGTVGNLAIASGARLAPGGSIGTLKVAGDLTMADGAIYEVEVDADGKADRVDVTGTAALAGSVLAMAAGGDYAPQTDYTILTADGGVTGRFGTVTSSLAFLDPTLRYDTTDVTLRLERNDTSFNSVAGTANQRATAAAVETLGMGNAVYDAVVLTDAGTASAAFESLSGDLHASAAGALMQGAMAVGDVVAAQGGLSGGGIGAGDAPASAAYGAGRMWLQAYGAWGSNDGDQVASVDRNSAGTLFGLDAAVGDGWRIGAFAGFGQATVKQDGTGGKLDADSYHAGIYVATRTGAVGFHLGAAYSLNDAETSRRASYAGTTETLTAGYDVDAAQVFGEVNYRMATSQGAFEPFAGVTHLRLSGEDFTEAGGAAALSGDGIDMRTTFTTLGLRTVQEFGLGETPAAFRAELGWRHAFGDVDPDADLRFAAGGSGFGVTGASIAENAAILRTGLDIGLTDDAGLALGYGGQFGDDATDHSVTAKLHVRF
ncbi:autotransporter domain-containing protein [Tistrella bauzanensis]|nr:autotransporter domain-containing protein [Tistrella bauzanensis]